MKRYAINDLRTWKKSRHRKPLLVQGARQVGKTWLLREFGRQEYANTAYVNLAENDEAAAAFEGTLHVDGLVRKLSAAAGEAIQAGETLIVLDEIQASERALNALKFFRENAPQYHVAAAGSLLGVALNHNHMSFPVGQVDFLDLHPLGFCEFLEALGEDALCGYLQRHDWELMETMRARYTELLRLYLCIGGMPEAVAAFAEAPDFAAVGRIHRAILQSYENDFGKYISRKDFANIRAVWGAVPRMLAHERKFSYSKVKPSGRGRDFEGSIEWLCRSGLLHRVSRVTKPSLPLAAYGDSAAFKLYMLDCGLLTTMAGVDADAVLQGNVLFTEFKGALAEQYVLQTLKLNEDLPIAYWATDSNSAEVDFIFSRKGNVIPLEVKAAANLKSKSLQSYRTRFNPPYAVRTSLAGMGEKDALYSVPLYAMEQLMDILP